MRLDHMEQARKGLHGEHRLRPACCCQTSSWPGRRHVPPRATKGNGWVGSPQPASSLQGHRAQRTCEEGREDRHPGSQRAAPLCQPKFSTEDAQLFQVCKESAMGESGALPPGPSRLPSAPGPPGHACHRLRHRQAGEVNGGDIQSQ